MSDDQIRATLWAGVISGLISRGNMPITDRVLNDAESAVDKVLERLQRTKKVIEIPMIPADPEPESEE